MIVIVYTAPGRPSFEVPADTTSPMLRQMVAHRYGAQGIGVPHTWGARLIGA